MCKSSIIKKLDQLRLNEWRNVGTFVGCNMMGKIPSNEISNKFRTDIALMDMDTGELFSRDVRLIYLQLPRFEKELEECDTLFEKWIYVLKHMEVLERLPKGLQLDIFKKLAEVTDVASLSTSERLEYDIAMKRYRDSVAMIQGAEQRGEEKGRTEERAETAKKLKGLGVSLDIIQASTGLSIEEIAKL